MRCHNQATAALWQLGCVGLPPRRSRGLPPLLLPGQLARQISPGEHHLWGPTWPSPYRLPLYEGTSGEGAYLAFSTSGVGSIPPTSRNSQAVQRRRPP